MKKLINCIFLLLISSQSFAGGSGGGGVRPSRDSFLVLSGDSESIGVRPEMNFISDNENGINHISKVDHNSLPGDFFEMNGGASGGGVGPRPNIGAKFARISSGDSQGGGGFINASGVDGSGTGPRPTAEIRKVGGGWMNSVNSKSVTLKLDYVKALEIDEDGQIKFKFKGFDSSEVQTHTLDLNSLSDEYIEAIKKSQVSRKWEAVPVQ
jgi:hypothetical protein